jgi:hypothetical protein
MGAENKNSFYSDEAIARLIHQRIKTVATLISRRGHNQLFLTRLIKQSRKKVSTVEEQGMFW